MLTITAVFIIPPRVHLLDMTGPAHIFYEAACYGAPVKSMFAGIFTDHAEEVSSSELAFHHLTPYHQLNLNSGDLIFIPGLEWELLNDTVFMEAAGGFRHWLRSQHQKGIIISSVCTGAFLLADSGLLDGKNCTTHWKYTDRFKQKYPQIKLETNRLFVQQDGIYTSAGVSSGIDLALYLVEQLWGATFAAQVAKEVVIYFRRSLNDPQLSIFTQYRNHLEQRIHMVQDALSQSLDKKFSIEELSAKVNMSPRNLTRLFKQTTETTIGAYLNQLRLERAVQLINEGHTLQSAASHCGLKSTSQLRSLLKEHHLAQA